MFFAELVLLSLSSAVSLAVASPIFFIPTSTLTSGLLRGFAGAGDGLILCTAIELSGLLIKILLFLNFVK